MMPYPYSNSYNSGYYPNAHSPASVSSWGTVHVPPTPFNQYLPANIIVGVDISRGAASQLKPQDLSQQAFSPPLSKIDLWVGPRPTWVKSIQNPYGITIQDLLTGIYGLYYKPLDANDVSSVGHDTMAHAKRQAQHRLDGRLQRVDLLCGHTRIDKIHINDDYSSCHVTTI